MTKATCPICSAPQDQGLTCHACTSRLERELGDVRAITTDLDVTISKQARLGPSGKGAPARERTPVNWGAVAVADNLANVLTTWARDVSELAGWVWVASKTPPAVQSAAVMLTLVDTIRRHPAVAELYDEITDAIQQARRAVDRPADKVYLGQCLMETPDDEGRQVTCLAELYARPQAHEVRCSVCSTEHPVAERRAWLLERAANMLFTAKDAALLIGEVGGITISQASIRGYVHRQKLAYRAPVDAKRFRLGDLLTVVLDESERKGAA